MSVLLEPTGTHPVPSWRGFISSPSCPPLAIRPLSMPNRPARSLAHVVSASAFGQAPSPPTYTLARGSSGFRPLFTQGAKWLCIFFLYSKLNKQFTGKGFPSRFR